MFNDFVVKFFVFLRIPLIADSDSILMSDTIPR